MIVFALAEKCARITITNDKTFEEVQVECRNFDEEREILIDLIKKLIV